MHVHGLQTAFLFLGEQCFHAVAGLHGFRAHVGE